MTTPAEQFYAFEHLPPPSLVQEVNAQTEAASRIAGLRADVPGWDGDPTDAVSKNIENGSTRLASWVNWVNSAARSLTKRFSAGTDVDNVLSWMPGLDRLDGESDILYKRRASDIPFQQVPVTPSAIRAAVRSLSGYAEQIADVQPVLRANKQDYDVYVLASSTGQDDSATYPGTPTTALLNAVQAYWQLDDSRPIWCTIYVSAPTFVPFTVTAALSYDRRRVPSQDVIPTARAALYQFLTDNYFLGQPISLEQIRTAMMIEGVFDVVLSSPAANLPAPTSDLIYHCPQTDAAVTLTATDIAPP